MKTIKYDRNVYDGKKAYTMIQQEKDGVEYLTFPAFSSTGLVEHFFSTRTGGVSKGDCATMNFSFTRGDEREAVLENYRRAAGLLHCGMEDFVCSDQTHTTNIRVVTDADRGKGVLRERDYRDIDGLITRERGIMLVTYYADCVPLFFLDPVQQAVGLAHSGWRGTCAKMGQHMVCAMKKQFGTDEKDLLVGIGPSICRECYEVSKDVAEAFEEAFPDPAVWKRFLFPVSGEKYHLDLWEANRQIFLEAGLLPEQILISGICTSCNSSVLFSHRASHGKRGNLAAFMGLRNN